MSAARVQQIVSGPEATRAADQLRRASERRSSWPYDKLEAPPEAIDVNRIGTAVVDAAGVTTTIVSLLVPAGYRFILQALWLCAPNSLTFVPGDALFSIFVNPNNGVQSRPEQDLVNLPVPLGMWQFGIYHVLRQPREFAGLDLITAQAVNVNLSAGPPNAYVAGLFGYRLPA